jgi:hypothetical protein
MHSMNPANILTTSRCGPNIHWGRCIADLAKEDPFTFLCRGVESLSTRTQRKRSNDRFCSYISCVEKAQGALWRQPLSHTLLNTLANQSILSNIGWQPHRRLKKPDDDDHQVVCRHSARTPSANWNRHVACHKPVQATATYPTLLKPQNPSFPIHATACCFQDHPTRQSCTPATTLPRASQLLEKHTTAQHTHLRSLACANPLFIRLRMSAAHIHLSAFCVLIWSVHDQ